MIRPTALSPLRRPSPGEAHPRLRTLAAVVACGVLPLAALGTLLAESVRGDVAAFDYRVFHAAAEAVLDGETPYADPGAAGSTIARSYVYPPTTALAAIPLTVLPDQVAGVLVMLGLAAAVAGTLLLLGVRDWRCYGIVFLWPPVLSAIQTGSVTILLGLAAALAWRFRDTRPGASAASVAAGIAVKPVLWPLALWLAATGRMRACLAALAGAAAALAVSWAAIEFAGLAQYPELVRALQRAVEDDAYTLYVVALDAGASSAVARAVWLAFGLALAAILVLRARRGDDRAAFVTAVAAGLALAPLVWLHYFALLLLVVAVARPTLGPAWFLPLALFVTPGSGNASPVETSVTLAAAAATIAIALHGLRGRAAPVGDARADARAAPGAA